MNLNTKLITKSLGIEIFEFNFENANIELENYLRELLIQHHLIYFHNQFLDEEKLIAISKIFGEPTPALVPTFRLEKFPVITKHTNLKDENNVPMGVVAPENVFHSDSYFSINPSKATLLYSLESPSNGGKTHFTNMCHAYDLLNDDTKFFIEDKKAIYKNAFINQPPVKHPIVRKQLGKKALFINIHRLLGIEGISSDVEAMNLAKKLYQHSIENVPVYKHKWRNGDLLIWNNPTTMHCATHIEPHEKRLLYRILTKGDYPVA